MMAQRVFRASRLWGSTLVTPTKMFLPDTVIISKESVQVKKYGWFGLTGSDERIGLDRIVSVRLKRGVFTGAILVETEGGFIPDLYIKGMWKRSAERAAAVIEAASLGQPLPEPLASKAGPVPDVSLRDFFVRGWELFQPDMWTHIGFTALVLVLHAIPGINVLLLGLDAVLLAGLFTVALRRLKGQDSPFAAVVVGFKEFRRFISLVLVSLVGGVMVLIGFIFFLLPGFYLATKYMFAVVLLVDGQVDDFWEALRGSSDTVGRNLSDFSIFALALVALNILGFAAVLVGFAAT